MPKRFFATTALFVFGATAVAASPEGEALLREYRAENFTRVEVKEGPTQYKVEAFKDGMKVEVIYDRNLRILKQETERADPGEDRPGFELRSETRDFLRVDDRVKGRDDDRPEDEADEDEQDDGKGRGRGRGRGDDDRDRDRDDEDRDDEDRDDDDRDEDDNDDDDDDDDDKNRSGD